MSVMNDRTQKISAELRGQLIKELISTGQSWRDFKTHRGINASDLSNKELLFDACDYCGVDVRSVSNPETKKTEEPEKQDMGKTVKEAVQQGPSVPAEPTGLTSEEMALIEALRNKNKGVSEERVLELIKENSGRPAHCLIDIRQGSEVLSKTEGLAHFMLPALVAGINAGVPIMLVGPAGSGKTFACQQASKILGRDFEFTGAISSEYKLSGFVDAQGRIVSTGFRRAFEQGKVFCFDEVDGSLPAAVLAFNAATAGGDHDFPDGVVKRHPDFRVVAAANTFGRGADRQYVGRFQQDAASLDRYAVLEWDYDPSLEAALVGAPKPANAPEPVKILPVTDKVAAQREAERWFDHVAKVRQGVLKAGTRHVVSPRATLNGAKLLAAGWSWKMVEEACLWKGLDKESKSKVLAAA